MLNRLLEKADLSLVRKSELAEFLGETTAPPSADATVPAGAEAYLAPDSPRLVELRERYRGHPAAVHSKWTAEFVRSSVDLRLFRRDNAYVYQTRRNIADIQYVLTAYHVRSIDRLGLWSCLSEDGAFGCHLVDFNGERFVSRDLLDSIIEINFLDEILDVSGRKRVRMLDVGAGYGRLAHRLVEGMPNVEILCADTVPESTFISEFYLRFRAATPRAAVAPLDEVEGLARAFRPDLAVNIHSFSECPLASIAWWIDLLTRCGVRYLFLVPNTGEDLLTTEVASTRGVPGERLDFMPILARSGYRLLAKRPKYSGASSLQAHGLFPSHYFVFELAS